MGLANFCVQQINVASTILWPHWLLISTCYTFPCPLCRWLAASQWFSPGNPFSSTNKTDRHDITEIKLKVLLNTIILPHTHTPPPNFSLTVFNILWSYNAAFGIALYYTNVILNCNFLLCIFKFNIYFFLLNLLIFFGLIFCPAVSKQYIQKRCMIISYIFLYILFGNSWAKN